MECMKLRFPAGYHTNVYEFLFSFPALRIHVSPECRGVLMQLGGYRLQPRGAVHIKGKGDVFTYFLEGTCIHSRLIPQMQM